MKLAANEKFLGWSGDQGRVYVATWDGPKARVDLLDLASGRRTFLREVVVSDPAGMLHTPDLRLSADARSYVYAFTRMESTLYVVTGLR
jgi:hypothetical protein